MSDEKQPAQASHNGGIKRFYKSVTTKQSGDNWVVLLDGRTVRSPGRNELLLPGRELAEHIAREWDAQTTTIDPVLMPLTKLCHAACDSDEIRRREMREEVVQYAGNDLLCYRAEHPDELVLRQVASWDPILFWAAEALNIGLDVAAGIMPLRQSRKSLQAFDVAIDPYCDNAYSLTAFHEITRMTGSALLALTHACNHLSAGEIWSAAHLEEDWQIDQWGGDDEAALRRKARKIEMMAAVKLLELMTKSGKGLG